jgi:repressor LexA
MSNPVREGDSAQALRFVSCRVSPEFKERLDTKLGRGGVLASVMIDLLEKWVSDSEKGSVSVPVVGRIAAGQSILAEENIEDQLLINDSLAHGASFALTVSGDSMAPYILPGDIVLVRQQTEAQNNQIVVAVFDEDRIEREGSVKRLRREFGSAELRSENDAYPPITESFSIVGIVVGMFRHVA